MKLVRYDKEADILYIRLSDHEIHHTEVIEEDSVLLDVDSEGKAVGVELMDASDYLREQVEESAEAVA